MNTDQKHHPRRDVFGVLVCDTCTVLENRQVKGQLVAMYWAEGNCPGNPQEVLDTTEERLEDAPPR